MTGIKRITTDFKKEAIKNLPNDKPVVYKIFNDENENIYTGVAKRGRVIERLLEHLPGRNDSIPGGKKVQIERMKSIDDAVKKETNIIARTKPKYNKKGK